MRGTGNELKVVLVDGISPQVVTDLLANCGSIQPDKRRVFQAKGEGSIVNITATKSEADEMVGILSSNFGERVIVNPAANEKLRLRLS